ncbi:MAG: hypothetical protein ACTSX8_10830 [Alphaproteobacteria bacterium]
MRMFGTRLGAHVAALGFAVALAGCGATVSAPRGERLLSEAPILSTTIDFLDYCWSRTDPAVGYFTEKQYEEVIRSLAEAGVGKIYLRVSACGLTLYPTKVGKQYAGDGREPGSTYLANTLAKYDPAQKLIEFCRKYRVQPWCWETLFDDEATMLHYTRRSDKELYEKYGEYPLKAPFLIRNPQYQWALDPRLKAHQVSVAERNSRSGPIAKIKILSDSPRPNRVARGQFGLYVSSDNRVFRRYAKPFSFKVLRPRPAILLLDGLDIAEPYLKLGFNKPWPQDRRFTICGDPDKFVQLFYDGAWHKALAVLRKQSGNWESGGGDFLLGTGRFAWDYDSYTMVIAKFLPPLPDYYGMIELAYPQAKAHKLAKLEELARYDFDGFAYSMRSHSRSREPGAYGYNDIIRNEYLRRYGKDIWKDDFDRAKWLDLRAEAVNEYLAMASKAVAPRPLYMDWPATGERSPYSRRYGGLPFEVDRWLQAHAVAGVRVMSCPEDRPISLDFPGADRVKLVRFVDNWRLPSPDAFRSNLTRWFSNARLDEVELYEAILYTTRPAYLRIMREVTDRLRSNGRSEG